MDDSKNVIFIIILAVLVFGSRALIYGRYFHYECPKCHKHFKLGLIHMGFCAPRLEVLKCPYCGETKMMWAVCDYNKKNINNNDDNKSDENDKISKIICPNCGFEYDMDYPKCPSCKHINAYISDKGFWGSQH